MRPQRIIPRGRETFRPKREDSKTIKPNRAAGKIGPTGTGRRKTCLGKMRCRRVKCI